MSDSERGGRREPQRLPDGDLQRNFQLYFLAGALDHALPLVEEIQRLAAAAGIPWEGLRGELALDQLRQMREDVTEVIFTTRR